MLFAEFYTSYHAHRRFATEVIGTDPETWLAFHPEGPTVFEVVTDMIDNQREIELAESHLNARLGKEEDTVDDETADSDQTAPDDDHEVTLEDLMETRYEALTSIWKDAISSF